MEIYDFSVARQKLSYLLQVAFKKGEARLKDKDGNLFIIKPEKKAHSPLDVEGLGLNLSRQEVLDVIKEGRKHK